MIKEAVVEPGVDSRQDGDSPGDDASTPVASSSLVGRLWRFRSQYRDGRDAEKVLRGGAQAEHGHLRAGGRRGGEYGAECAGGKNHSVTAGGFNLGYAHARGFLAW